jgi:NAD(P)-dependent dehydrogenase (short-subunit alcohol dehydrogenase family)
LEEALKSLEKRKAKSPEPGKIYFHGLDLSTVIGTRFSAMKLEERLKASEAGRIDILVNNAGIASSIADLGPDGYDNTFAVNCLGHFVFIDTLLGMRFHRLH